MMLGAVLSVGCREQGFEPAHNRNLGSAEAPLLPPQSAVLDTNITGGPRVQPIELPEFDEDLPTLAEMESEAAKGSEQAPPAEGELEDDLAAGEGVGQDDPEGSDDDAGAEGDELDDAADDQVDK